MRLIGTLVLGVSDLGIWTRYVTMICAILYGAIFSCSGTLADYGAQPTFEKSHCDLPDVGADVGGRLSCGTVRVPRDPASPNAGTFRLNVVVVRSETQPSRSDPVIYINGGPGNPLTIYADHQAPSRMRPTAT